VHEREDMGVRSAAARKNIARYVLSLRLYEFSQDPTPKALSDGMDVPYVDKQFMASILLDIVSRV